MPNAPLSPPMNLTAALIVADRERELLHEMMEALLAECPRQMAVLHTALQHGDARSLESIAHSPKGTLSTVEASHAQALAQEIEAQGREGELEEIPSIVQRLGGELARLSAFWTEVRVTAAASTEPL